MDIWDNQWLIAIIAGAIAGTIANVAAPLILENKGRVVPWLSNILSRPFVSRFTVTVGAGVVGGLVSLLIYPILTGDGEDGRTVKVTSPPPTPGLCTPTPGVLHAPQIYADRLWYTVNDAPEESIADEGVIEVMPGDQFCVVRLEYHAVDKSTPDDRAQGEVYIRKPNAQSCDSFDYNDLEVWVGDPIDEGANALETLQTRVGDGCWIIEEEWDRLVVALLHYGTFGHEIDHRFYVNLRLSDPE